MEKNLALSVDQSQLWVLQFSMHLIDLLSILLRYNYFARIQKALVDQTSSRPPNNDHDLFFGVSLGFPGGSHDKESASNAGDLG